jgi:hypothetical protein
MPQVAFANKPKIGVHAREIRNCRRIRGRRIPHPDPNGAIALNDRIARNPRRSGDLAVPVGIVNAGTAAVEAQAVIGALHDSLR